jgi:hypothetical protein
MMLALLWLTVSTPFIFRAQQQLAATEKKANTSSSTDKEEESSNPLNNTTEEKAPSGSNTLNEYLHDAAWLQHPSPLVAIHNTSHTADTYTAFHGELTGPPPKL